MIFFACVIGPLLIFVTVHLVIVMPTTQLLFCDQRMSNCALWIPPIAIVPFGFILLQQQQSTIFDNLAERESSTALTNLVKGLEIFTFAAYVLCKHLV